MKKKFLTMFSIVLVLAFAVAVYAYNQTNVSAEKTTSCCAKKDNCPLKNKQATAETDVKTSCCDNADCCCKTGSCPMKAKSENASSENCCDNCCGGSCPMKNKESQMTAIQTSGETIANGENCQHKRSGI